MARADDCSHRACGDAAAGLYGVDLILECERAASRAIRGIAIQNDGAKAPGAATSTPQPALQASSTRSAFSDDRT